MGELDLNDQQQLIGAQIIREIRARVGFLVEVGLDYLSLGRATGTLSGGEAQRIRLATQIGSGLVGVAYILDEPSIGLHQRDNDKLLAALQNLKELGNTLIVVEHDEDTMRAADFIVDIGPAAGEHGGEVIVTGTAEDIMANPDSITGAYLSGRIKIPVPAERKQPSGWLTVKGAKENNLKNIDVKIPLGIMTCITGVSGSGKSSLTNEILYKAMARKLNRARCIPGKHDKILGLEQLDKVIDIDQSPIGRTPRSNPATYTGVFDMIRDLFAATPDAKARGYKKGRFSFNVKGGRCEAWTGMVNEMNRLDVITNNLANADTNGYKKEGATAESFKTQLAMRIKDSSVPTWRARAIGDVNMGVKIGETYTDYDQGSFKVTDNKYDCAIDGNGFFAVSFTDKAGNTSVKYTRDGAFTISTDGFLRTKDGDYVLNQNGAQNGDPAANNFIQLDPNVDFTIDKAGFIYQNDQLAGQIGLIDFENYDFLSKYGENMYDLVEGGQVIASNASIEQGYIEASNVKVVDEMVTMITIARAYESNQKMIQTFDSMLDKAVNQVGRVG